MKSLIEILIVCIILIVLVLPMIHIFVRLTIAIALLCVLILFAKGVIKDSYFYNYERENPNGRISGRPVAGTVYVDDPSANPGLGWIN